MKEGLKRAELTGMRIEIIEGANGVTILNDAYNASPTSVRAAVNVLNKMKGYRNKIAVLGDMLELGEDEVQFHQEVGEYLTTENTDLLFAYGRLGKEIAVGAKKHLAPDNIYAYDDKSELIHKLISVLHPKDVVLVKASRGMKLEEVVEVVKHSKLHQ